MSMKQRKTCGECIFWDQQAHAGYSGKRGLCRVRPPSFESPNREHGCWPHTHESDWCGAFKEDADKRRTRHLEIEALEGGHESNYDRSLDKAKRIYEAPREDK